MTTGRILSLALVLIGACLAIYGFAGLYDQQFRALHRWSGFEASLGGAYMIWGGLFFRHDLSNPPAAGVTKHRRTLSLAVLPMLVTAMVIYLVMRRHF